MDMPIPKVETAEEMPGHVKMAYPAGTAYFFNGRLYHSAGSQRGAKDRRVLIYNYGHKWMRIWQGYEPSPELQSRARTPLRRQLLGMTDPYGYGAE
jgi:ectoine hydroxylase-related dioxygenase (phytanoyl-CoA dioxygenase family)